jgi:hypothetical protein
MVRTMVRTRVRTYVQGIFHLFGTCTRIRTMVLGVPTMVPLVPWYTCTTYVRTTPGLAAGGLRRGQSGEVRRPRQLHPVYPGDRWTCQQSGP